MCEIFGFFERNFLVGLYKDDLMLQPMYCLI